VSCVVLQGMSPAKYDAKKEEVADEMCSPLNVSPVIYRTRDN
jgi:hypothetical protein